MASSTIARRASAKRKSKQHDERLRVFDPELVAKVRGDLKKAHGKPLPLEPSIMQFMEQFFDDIHQLRLVKNPWEQIHEGVSKYVDCSSRTLQTYYNIVAEKRGVLGERRRGRRRREVSKH